MPNVLIEVIIILSVTESYINHVSEFQYKSVTLSVLILNISCSCIQQYWSYQQGMEWNTFCSSLLLTEIIPWSCNVYFNLLYGVSEPKKKNNWRNFYSWLRGSRDCATHYCKGCSAFQQGLLCLHMRTEWPTDISLILITESRCLIKTHLVKILSSFFKVKEQTQLLGNYSGRNLM